MLIISFVMQETKDEKAYYYFDESGTPEILGRKGKNLIESGKSSRYFIIGFISTTTPRKLSSSLLELRKELASDAGLASIPSMKNTLKSFHANRDCRKARDRVFDVLKNQDFEFYCIVARKRLSVFKGRFKLKDSRLYEYLVSRILEDKLHIYREIDCYFSSMKNVVRADTMASAIKAAMNKFESKWKKANTNTINILIEKNEKELNLQATDYMLWAVYQAFENDDFKYLEMMSKQTRLIIDVFSSDPVGTYYSSRNPLTADKKEIWQD